jgi:hypothetical protein
MAVLEGGDGYMGHHYDCSGDQVDAWMLDVIDGTGGIPLLFFRSNGSPGNMSHSRITSYPLYKHNNTAPPTTECSIVPFSMESDAVSAGMAWRILILPLPNNPSFFSLTVADFNQNR